MSVDLSIATPLAAFAIGLATSLHCAGMCGPLACAVRVRPWEYHLTRFVSYTAAGALCGAAGQGIVRLFRGDTMRAIPWALAVVLVILAFGLEKHLPQPRCLAALLLRVRLQHSLGWLTPLLPCGPLWLMLAAAALTGSALRGALHIAAFVAGTVPLYWLLQSGFVRAQTRFSPAVLLTCQRSLATISAALLIWRASLPADACCH